VNLAPLAYSVNETLAKLGIGPDKLYKIIKAKQLPARKLGKRTLILASDLNAFIESLPQRLDSPVRNRRRGRPASALRKRDQVSP
jgi:excisionase family DNA binding protein